MMKTKCLLGFILIITIFGCTDLGIISGNNSGGDKPVIIADNRIIMTPIEHLDTLGRYFTLSSQTEEIYGCMNYSILYTKYEVNNMINIDFNGIDMPEFCLTALGPAVAEIILGEIPNGKYSLKFKNEDYSIASLDVTDESFLITCEDTSQVIFEYKELMRVPANTIWGWVEYNTTDSAVVAQSFLDSLINIGAISETYSPGYYRYFSIDENGDIQYNGGHGSRYILPFIFYYTGDTLAIHNVVDNFADLYHPNILTVVYNDNGNSFYSWMMVNK